MSVSRVRRSLFRSTGATAPSRRIPTVRTASPSRRRVHSYLAKPALVDGRHAFESGRGKPRVDPSCLKLTFFQHTGQTVILMYKPLRRRCKVECINTGYISSSIGAANAHQTVYINQCSYALEVYPDQLGLYTSMMINNVYDLSMYHL